MGRSIFVGYKFTGEPLRVLECDLGGIVSALTQAGHDVFCSLALEPMFKEKGWTDDEIYAYCLEQFTQRDTFFAFVSSPERSRGLTMESERAQGLGLQYVLAIRPELEFPDYRQAANIIIEYSRIEELCDRLRELH